MEKLDDHYAKLLGLEEPWRITDVDLRLEGSNVEIALEHPVGQKVKCPECGGKCAIADHAPERRWRHLDTMRFTTELVARTPRADCPGCGVKTIAVPWAGKSSRFTLMFEAFAERCYDDDGSLLSRSKPGAVLDRESMLAQVGQLQAEATITTISGKILPLQADTLCVHGDNLEGVKAIQAIRALVDGN